MVRLCSVSFTDARGIRHAVEVEAESLYEAVVVAVRRFREDPWSQQITAGTQLDVDVREPVVAVRHSISLLQVERWLASATSNPSDASKKAKLKTILIQRYNPSS